MLVYLKKHYEKVIFFVMAIIVLLFTSECSFLWKINNSVDANIFLLGGKLNLNGKLLYRDFFEQKGVLLYLFYALSLLITPTRFWGMYCFEIIAAFYFYLYTYKSLKILKPTIKDNYLCVITVIGCSISYISHNMINGGQIEEFCLPLIMYFIYLICKVIYLDEVNNKGFLLSGLYIGIIFWMKYFCLISHFILFVLLVIYLLKRRQYKSLNIVIKNLIYGFCFVLILMLIYFIYTGTFNDMLQIYFYENIFKYDRQKYNNITAIKFIQQFIICNLYIMPIYIGSLFVLLFKIQKDVFLRLIFIAHLLLLVVITMCKAWQYYYLPTFVFLPLEFIYLIELFKQPIMKQIVLILSIILMGFMYITDTTNHKIDFNESQQYKVAKIINQIENPRLLVLSSDAGYYFASNTLPLDYYYDRVFVRGNLIRNRYIEMIKNHEIDFIVFKQVGLPNHKEIDWSNKFNLRQKNLLNNNGYELVYYCDDKGRDEHTSPLSMITVYKLVDKDKFTHG